MVMPAQFIFDKPSIKGIVTTVGKNKIYFDDESLSLGLTPKEMKRMKNTFSLGSRHIASQNETTVDYCLNSAKHLLKGLDLNPSAIQGVIFVTQSPNYTSPSSAIKLQHLLGIPITSIAFDVHLGCSGFVYGLLNAFSFIQSGLERIILCVGDVASSFVNPKNHTLAPIMGDAGSAILIEKASNSSSYFQLYSDGSGEKALYIPNSGCVDDFDEDGQLLESKMLMDGASVFTFTLKRIPKMIDDIIHFSGSNFNNIDYFVLHQPNKYILKNIQKRMNISLDKMPISTQSVYGNQNSASIPGTINGFLSEQYTNCKNRSLFGGFGVGLSWGSAILETSDLYCPPSIVGLPEKDLF